jgi:protoporphyrinogen/coproporphyrinogen III oxidase
MSDTNQIVVIGGGISGLACAFRLQQLGADVSLLEAGDRAGGLIASVEKDGFLFESGPQSFQGTPALFDLIHQLGIESELLKADPRAPRFVYLGSKLQKIPMSPQALLTSSMLGPGSRLKIASERFRRTKPPNKEESVADFVRRKFGHEILEYLVSPFVSGVYAGDPEKLSLRAAFPTLDEWEREFGSVIRGAMKSRQAKGAPSSPPPLCSFQHGMGTFMRALAEKLGNNVRFGANVAATNMRSSKSPGGRGYEIRYVQGGRETTTEASAIIFATPAYAAAHLVEPISAQLGKTLSGIAYAPVAVVASGYHAHQFGAEPQGFGFLVPRSEKLRTLGTVFNSSLFPGRAPEEKVAITSFIGGATNAEIVSQDTEKIAAIVQEENARVLGITGPPIASAVWQHPKALPQYNLGHGHIVEAVRDAERELPGLFFAGNYLGGPAIGKCVEEAFKTAETARNYLQSAQQK